MNRYRWFLGLSLLVAASLACSILGGGTGGGGGSGATSAHFPIPGGASSVTTTSGGDVNFQVNLSIKDAIAFYRQAFTTEGLKERTINTAITDTTFSMIFDGDPGGQAIVVQGVDLGSGKTNISIRYEKV